MDRRVGAHASAGRAAMGEDLGCSLDLFAGTGGTALLASLTAPWSNGRTLALTCGEVRVRIPAGQPRISGTGAAGNSTGPKPQPGIEPRAMIAKPKIARRADSFNSEGLGREHSLR